MPPRDLVPVPPGYPTATVFIDESGSKSSADFFVVAAIKTRFPGRLARAIHGVREKRDWHKRELKYSGITAGSVDICSEIIEVLEASDAHIAACVVDGRVFNPFTGIRRAGRATWQIHGEVVSQLLVGCINKRELVGVLMDGISTPPGCSLADTVRLRVNQRLHATAVVSAACLDSTSNDVLQVADLVAGSILHERRRQAAGDAPRSHKGRVALRLAHAFDRPGLVDGRAGRVNIQTYRGRRATIANDSAPSVVDRRSGTAREHRSPVQRDPRAAGREELEPNREDFATMDSDVAGAPGS